MALLIEKNTKILGDIDVSELYVRFALNYNMRGGSFELFSEVFPSRASYDAGGTGTEVDGIPFSKGFSYDRSADGSDLLTAAHNKFKTFLSTDVMTSEVVIDPSTGLQLEDPSTGELYWMNGDPSTQLVISIPKFASDSSISLIDID